MLQVHGESQRTLVPHPAQKNASSTYGHAPSSSASVPWQQRSVNPRFLSNAVCLYIGASV